jgi:ABC-2 type transport system permease protein
VGVVAGAAVEDGAHMSPTSSRSSFWSAALAIAARSIHNVFTNPALILPSLIFPLFFFTAFAGGLSRVDSIPGFSFPPGYTAFQFVFVLLQSSAFAGVFTGFGVARDFEMGFGRRLLLAAPRRAAIVVGYLLSGLTRALFTMVIITVVALVAGMQVDGSGVDLFGLYGLAVLVNIAASLWAVGVALRVRTIQGGPLMQVPVFLTLFLAPVYLPLSLLSGWIHGVASVNPATAFLDAGRDLIAGRPTGIAVAFAIAVGLVGAFGLWAFRSLRSAEAAGG